MNPQQHDKVSVEECTGGECHSCGDILKGELLECPQCGQPNLCIDCYQEHEGGICHADDR